MLINMFLFFLFFLFFIIVLLKNGLFFLHMFQLESYKSKQFIKWYNENENRILPKQFSINLILLTLLIFVYLIINRIYSKSTILVVSSKKQLMTYFLYLLFLYYSVFFIYLIVLKKKKQKKVFVFTNRAKRLYTVFILINIAVVFTFFYLYDYKLRHCYLVNYCTFKVSFFELNNFTIFIVIYLFLIYLIPYTLYVASFIILPVEKKIRKKFYIMAKNKIEKLKIENYLKIVGVTGSFGKTSTKFITGEILSYYFKDKVIVTPESYNTTMGVCKVINNDLNSNHSYFVVEMGARNIGDIEEIAKLTYPEIGIITSIGPAHLETFKTIRNIAKTKFELIDNLEYPFVSILNGDNKNLLDYFNSNSEKKYKSRLNQFIFFGIDNKTLINESEYIFKDIFATDIKVTKEGLSFNIKYNYKKFEFIKNLIEKKKDLLNNFKENDNEIQIGFKKYIEKIKNSDIKYFDNEINNNIDKNNNTDKNKNSDDNYNIDELKVIRAKTKLLGKYNIYNILSATAVALSYGIDDEIITKAIDSLTPVEHRLQLIDPETGILVIDDAFNSNPEGAKMALEVLSQFKGYRKFIVTPGIIELGEKEYQINKEFGYNIASVCDYVILVENRVSKWIREGILKKGFDEKRVFVVKGLQEAQNILKEYLKPRDIVLFENDLPDNLEY